MRIKNVLSIGIILGVIAGCINAIQAIAAHQYIFYRMFRLAALSFQGCLNKSVLVALVIILPLSLLAKFLSRFFRAKAVNNCDKMKYARRTAVVFLGLLFLVNLSIFADGKINAPKGPNVILLIVDAWRADSLGCYNKDSDATVNVDTFAKNAALFKNAIAQSFCTINSAPSIFCSAYPFEHECFSYTSPVSDKFNTIAEFLKNEGYRTFGISTNPHVIKRTGLAQGFDIFIEDVAWKDTDCDEVNNKFIEWLEDNRESKFFAMLWYIDPHCPYAPPDEYIDKYITQEKWHISDKTKIIIPYPADSFIPIERIVSRKLYTGEVNFFDTEFDKLINYLKRVNIMENSLIILTADHGESLWEKKNILGADIAGHGYSLHKEQIRIPLN